MISKMSRHAKCLFVCLVLAFGLLPLFGQDRLQGWTTTGQTEVMALRAVEQTGLTVENLSPKIITAFAVSLSTDAQGRQIHYMDFFDTARPGIAPGQTYTLRIVLQPQDMAARTLRIEAAIFQDGSRLGSTVHSEFLRAKRLGRMLENERITRILKSGLGAGPIGTIGPLPTSIGDLPASADSAFRSLADIVLPGASIESVRQLDEHSQHGFLEGVRNAREEGKIVVTQISGLSGQTPQRDALNQTVKRYEDRSIMYRAYLEQVGRGGRQ